MTNLISTLEKGKPEFFALLWKRMGEQGDFPSLSKSVYELTETMHDEGKSITEVTAAILNDFTLTQKIIRLANSAMYAGIGGEITTVTKAAVVLGFDAITHLALSIRFVDKLSASSTYSVSTNSEMTKALIAGEIARNVAQKAKLDDIEEAVVCALMHHLGRLLLVFYFPDEWSKILRTCATKSLNENQGTLDVIGVTLDEISQEVAKSWRLPSKISESMTRMPSPGGANIPGSTEWLKSIANFAGEAAALTNQKTTNTDDLRKLASRYGDALLVSTDAIILSVNKAVTAASEFTILEDVEEKHGKPANSRERLAAGVLETTKAVSEGVSFGSALSLVLETMYGGMGFQRVAAFLRDGVSYRAKVGFGSMMPEVLPRLVFSEAYVTDVFHLSLANKADVFIEDACGAKAASSIPAWFTESLPDVRAFVLLPLIFNEHPIGLLYGDWPKGTDGLVEKDELLLMRSLRDHLMKLLASKRT